VALTASIAVVAAWKSRANTRQLLKDYAAFAAWSYSDRLGSELGETMWFTLNPIGHRQPRASDVPSEKNLSDPSSPVNKEDAALDRKIKSICRGC